jgi:hypothetical protein
MKPLTIEYIRENSKPHPSKSFDFGEARVFHMYIGEYLLSIVGGGQGLYGDFITSFEVALIDTATKDFVTSKYTSSSISGDVLMFASIDDINEIYYNIPRKK